MVTITLLVTIYLFYAGYDYYNTVLEERFYHPRHKWFKPSGAYGHGLGIIGTFLIVFGVSIYIARKRYNFMSKYIRLKYLLEFHIFLCTIGPIMILFHTAFKFGGIVSVAFWSMVAVVLSGVIGRFIYIQIPRTIEGKELSLGELNSIKDNFIFDLKDNFNLSNETTQQIINQKSDKKVIKKILVLENISKTNQKTILNLIKKEMSLSKKIDRLHTMQKYFKYWHVAHLPFALIMLIIVIIHTIVTLSFGYKWIF
jgi:hypothetical protein